MEEVIKQFNDHLAKIEIFVRIGNKRILDFEEACAYTGYSEGHMYRLTSERRIPHSKRDRKIYFDKKELDHWMTENKIKTEADINSKAATYVSTHK